MEKSKIELIESIRIEIKTIIDSLKKNEEFLKFCNLRKNKTKTYFDLLSDYCRKYPEDTSSKNFKNNLSLILKKSEVFFEHEDKLMILKDIYDINTEKSFVHQIYAKADVTENEAISVAQWISSVDALIPDYFKKESFDILLVKSTKSYYDVKEKQMVLNIAQSPTNLISEIFHEFGHVLEIQNPTLYQESVTFVVKNSINNSILRSNVNRGRFVHPYVGTVYEWNSTEVVSLGLQMMFLNPVMFLFRDNDHFEFIDSILRKK